MVGSALPRIVFDGEIRPSSSKSSGSKALVEEKGESEKTSAAFRRRVLILVGDTGIDEGIAVDAFDGAGLAGLSKGVLDVPLVGEVPVSIMTMMSDSVRMICLRATVC